MKKGLKTYFYLFIILALTIPVVIQYGGPSFLRSYVETGVGTCQNIPILCMAPSETIAYSEPDKSFFEELIPHDFPKMGISVPKGFALLQETIKKVYYKKNKRGFADKVIYVLHEQPGFFTDLYPQVKKQGVPDNYEFIRRVMHASVSKIINLTDAFFVIMKGIFIPDVGDQHEVKMGRFEVDGKRGFINYNLNRKFFDCNLTNEVGGFFKVYIKDKDASLDLSQVIGIITTIVDKN